MIGDTLRKAREQKGLSVKDVERGTSIRALYIEAIEKGEYQTLPGEVYVKGFVRNYANFLGMDADACVRQYMEENHAAPIVPQETAPEPEQRRVNATHLVSGEDFRQRVEGSNSGAKAVLAVIVAAIVLGGAYFAFGADDSDRTAKKPPTATSQPKQAAKPAAKATEKAAPKPTEKAAPAKAAAKPAEDRKQEKAASGVEVSATFTDRCWTKVVADGQTVYEGTAEKGKTMSWTGNEKVAITAGNAGAVEFTHNGKRLGKAGELGEVVDKVFTKDQAN